MQLWNACVTSPDIWAVCGQWASRIVGSCHKDVKMFDILTNGERGRRADQTSLARNCAPLPTPKLLSRAASDLHQCQNRTPAVVRPSPDPALDRPDTYVGRPARRVTRINLDVHRPVTSPSRIGYCHTIVRRTELGHLRTLYMPYSYQTGSHLLRWSAPN